ncbi:MAG: hypothetical protein QXR58_02400 [Candidatus Micrarchaeaceae archaeon]
MNVTHKAEEKEGNAKQYIPEDKPYVEHNRSEVVIHTADKIRK